MIFWKDIGVVIHRKMLHCRKACGKTYLGIIKTLGDLPMGRFNEVTQKFEPVENRRGRAYATRNDIRYHKKDKRED